MEGNWLSKTRKAYIYHELGTFGDQNGWRLVMLHGQSDYESFWYPVWEMAVRAIPGLWRH